MKYILSIILVTGEILLNAQVTETLRFKNDFELLKTVISQTHPSLYRFTPQEKFQETLDSLDAVFENDVTELQFFQIVSKVESLVRESHFHIYPPEQLMENALKSHLFPFTVRVGDDRLLVTSSSSKSYEDLVGSEILAINGKSISTILNIMANSAGLKSGFNLEGFRNKLSHFHNFSLAYYFYADTTGRFDIKYFNEDGTEGNASITGSGQNLNQTEFPKFPEEPVPPFHLEIDEQSDIAVLRITTFAHWVIDLEVKDYLKFFRESFKTLQRKAIETLIIDVRGNRGGNEMIAAELLTYFINEDFKVYRYAKAGTLDFSFIADSLVSEKLELEPEWVVKTDSAYYIKENGMEVLKTYEVRKKDHFDGDVYMLSDGGSRSATNTFLSLAKTYKAATIVGTESGGVFEDVDNGYGLKFTLPYSKIKVNCPVMSLKIDAKNGDRLKGVAPDHPVEPTRQDILGSSDRQLEYTYELIRKSKR